MYHRGWSSKSEHVTSRTATDDKSTSSSKPNNRWGRLKRSHSDDGVPTQLLNQEEDNTKRKGGKRHVNLMDNNSLEGSRSKSTTAPMTTSWFRKQPPPPQQLLLLQPTDVACPDHNNSTSETCKKITMFQRSRGQHSRDDNENNLRTHGTTHGDYLNVPVFYNDDDDDDNDDDKDCVSSFAENESLSNTASKKAQKAQKPMMPKLSLFSHRHDRPTKSDGTGTGTSNVKSILNHSQSNDAIKPRGRAIMAPLRKNVSFESGNSSHDSNRFASSNQHLVIHKIVPTATNYSIDQQQQQEYNEKSDDDLDYGYGRDNEKSDDDLDYGYGYNTNHTNTIDTLDFPMPKNTIANAIDFPMPKKNPPTSTSEAVVPSSSKAGARERARYSVYQGNSKVKKKLRVRPYHCFPDEAVMMTEEEIYAESLNKSKDFVPLKSYLAPSTKQTPDLNAITPSIRELWGTPETDGRIGSLRVEVLGCVGLNRTKPDISVYIVCGDSAFCTDVITGYRSPMWPTVSRRACIVPIHHAYAKMFIGVFDVKKRTNKENDVFCGRVAIDIACIRPNTEYDTTMPLRASTFVYDKRKRGVVRIRFSIHWFNECAAATSYLKPARSLLDSCPLVDGQPTIPCADPKTFRNVAVTVYGQDLPGKYSKNAFRATVRELTLYQQNLRVLCKVLLFDAMLYEEPWISLYLFVSAIYCVFYNTVAMVPALTVGYIIILYVENYRRYVENNDFHFGYKPLTIFEVFKAVAFNKDKNNLRESFFQSIDVEKKTKRRQGKHENDCDMSDDNGDVVRMDHREFPFSDRDAYPKFSVEESIAPGSNKGGTGRLHGRLSVYYTTELPTSTENADEGDSDADSDRDDETVMTESQMLGDSLYDLDSDNDDEDYLEGTDHNYKLAMSTQSKGGAYDRRLRIGPPQDTDLSGGNKIPPQVQLKKVEALLHKFSRSVSVEMVHAPPSFEKKDTFDNIMSTGMTAPSRELQDKMIKKAKKVVFDEFDKLLGLQARNANPVHRIMSSFMGPLMRMIRVGIFLIRISFNVSTWRDPYLSFWVLMLLSSICFVLIFFPWRAFFLVASVVCLGPQVSSYKMNSDHFLCCDSPNPLVSH